MLSAGHLLLLLKQASTTGDTCWIDRVDPNVKHSIEISVLSTSDFYVVDVWRFSLRENLVFVP